jgi:hypothetical protein
MTRDRIAGAHEQDNVTNLKTPFGPYIFNPVLFVWYHLTSKKRKNVDIFSMKLSSNLLCKISGWCEVKTTGWIFIMGP